MKYAFKRTDRLAALRIVIMYALFAVLWIYLSDNALGLFVQDPAFLVRLSVLKGFLFIVVTGIILYQLITRYIQKSRQVEENLEESQNLINVLFEGTTDAIFMKDQRGRYLQFNKAASNLTGKAVKEVIGHDDTFLFGAEDSKQVMESDRRVMENGQVMTHEDHIKTADGTSRTFLTTKGPIIDATGKISGLFGIARDITERKQAEVALQKSASSLQAVIDSFYGAVYVADMETHEVLLINKYIRDVFGEIQGKVCWQTLQKDQTGPCPFCSNSKLIDSEGNPTGLYIWEFHNTVDRRWYECRDRAIRWIDGRMARMEIATDITEQKRVENEMELFRNLINRSSEAIFVNEPQTGRFINLNDRACVSLGYSREELLNMGVRDVETSFPDNFSWQEHMYEVKQKGYLLLEGVNKREDGTTFPVETNVSYITLDNRDYMIAIVRDITERKEAEQKLRKSEERLSKAQEMAHVGNWEWNVGTNGIYWSDEVYRIYGRNPKQFIPTFESVTAAMHPDDQAPFLKAVDDSLYENKHFEMDYRLIRPDGTERTAHTIGGVVRDEKGKPLVKLGTVQDITELKKIEEELRHSRELIKSILDTVDEAFLLIDANYRITLANNAYSRQAKMPLEAIIGKYCYEISHKRQNPCYEAGEECPVRHCFEKGEPHGCTHKHHGKEDEVIYVETRAYPMRDSSGKVTTVIEVINNVTDKHHLEEQILHTQKMEAVGTLAGGMAHDFNNLLTGILGHANLLTLRSQPNTPVYESARTIERAADRAAELTQQLLGFARRGKHQIQPVDIHGLILDVIRLLGRTIDKRIVISQRLLPGTPKVKGDPGQLQQVLMNLAINARDAMENNGELSFETGIANIDAEYGKTHYVAKQGRYLLISLTDTGCGIPKENLSRIFEPFFTTKDQGKGTGMGLAMVYGIVKNHDGYIDVYSEDGHGTTFKIYLPLEDEGQCATDEDVQPGEMLILGTERILIIDDEEIVRNFAKEILIDLGYKVVTAVDGEEGVKIYREEGGNFHLVVIDMVMPKLGGRDCFLELKKINPNIKAILSTGYGMDGKAQEILDEGVMGFIQKPYRINQLGQIVREVIAKQ